MTCGAEEGWGGWRNIVWATLECIDKVTDSHMHGWDSNEHQCLCLLLYNLTRGGWTTRRRDETINAEPRDSSGPMLRNATKGGSLHRSTPSLQSILLNQSRLVSCFTLAFVSSQTVETGIHTLNKHITNRTTLSTLITKYLPSNHKHRINRFSLHRAPLLPRHLCPPVSQSPHPLREKVH